MKRQIKQEIIERFGTGETLEGLLYIALGAVVIWKSQLILTVLAVLLVVIGTRKLLVNRVKRWDRDLSRLERRREARNGGAETLRCGAVAVIVALLVAGAPGSSPGQAHAGADSAPGAFSVSASEDVETSSVGLALIRHFEGLALFCYRDDAGHWTVGWGHLVRDEEYDRLCRGPLLPRQADSLLRVDVGRIETGVRRAVDVELRQWRFDAVVSWTFNLGVGALERSTMLRRINAERHRAVPKEMRRWVYADGRKLRGLVLRRAAEARLYGLA